MVLEILDIPIQIVISDLLLVVLLGIMLFQLPHLYFWLERRKWNPEGKIFETARKKGYPIIEKVAMSGFTKFELGEKETKGDPIFKIDRATNQGIHLDPRLSSGGAPREFIAGGAELMHYSTSSPVAMSSKNALAMSSILKMVRKDYQQFAILPDQLIIEIIYRNRADLPHDCRNIVEIYDFEGKIDVPKTVLDAFKEDVIEQMRNKLIEDGETREPLADEIELVYQQNVKAYTKQYQTKSIVELFIKIQDAAAILPVESNRYFSFVEAFQNSPIATFAADLQNYLQIIEMIEQKKRSLSEKDRLFMYAIVVVIIFIGGALAYQMLGK